MEAKNDTLPSAEELQAYLAHAVRMIEQLTADLAAARMALRIAHALLSEARAFTDPDAQPAWDRDVREILMRCDESGACPTVAAKGE